VLAAPESVVGAVIVAGVVVVVGFAIKEALDACTTIALTEFRTLVDSTSEPACEAPRTKSRWNSRTQNSRALSKSSSGAEMPATQENEIAIIVYAPALVGNDGRPLAIVHGMERAFPGLRLE